MSRIYRTGIKQYLSYTFVQTDKSMLVESLVVLAKNCSRLGLTDLLMNLSLIPIPLTLQKGIVLFLNSTMANPMLINTIFIVFLKKDV